MDEYEETAPIPARKHDRWTVFVLSLDYATQMITQTASFIGHLTEAAAQHREYLIEESNFYEVVRGEGVG